MAEAAEAAGGRTQVGFNYIGNPLLALAREMIGRLADAGKAVLLVSVELDEIMSLADRIAVMFDGRLMGERLPDKTDERELGLLMAGVEGNGKAA